MDIYVLGLTELICVCVGSDRTDTAVFRGHRKSPLFV